MHRIVASLLVCILPLLSFAQQIESVPRKLDYNNGYAEGQEEGSRISQSKWMTGGIFGGCLAGCVGGGILWLMAGSGDSPVYIPEGPNEYRLGYIEGYKDATKSKKQQSALIGGLIGTAIFTAFAIILVTQSEPLPPL